jgi:hypothetical protein
MKISPFQLTDAKNWQGLTTANHFRAIYQEDAQMAGSLINTLLENQYGPSLESILSKFPAETFDHDGDYVWKLQGSFERHIALTAAYEDEALTTLVTGVAGANRSEFFLEFEEYWFSDGMIIVGEKNELYPILLKGEPEESSGSGFVYRCEMALGSADGMPVAELAGGKLFSVEFTPKEDTMSVDGSDIQFTSPITMRNGFTTVRKQHKVPGNMVSRKMMAGWKNPTTKQTEVTWLEHVDWMLEYQFMLEKNRACYYGRTNRDANGRSYNIGKSGNAIKIGAGIREQMEVSNTVYWSTFSLATIETMLFDLSEGKLTSDERHFIIRTGERGAALFHKAVMDLATGWSPLRDDKAIYSVGDTPNALNARGYGFQFVEYIAPNHIKVTVEVDEHYTNFVRNKAKHPLGGRAESYRMDIFDIGTVDGHPNIQKAYVRGAENILRYEVGIRSPWDSAAKNIVSNSEDSYTIHRMSQFGAIVRDPQRTASYIPNVLGA